MIELFNMSVLYILHVRLTSKFVRVTIQTLNEDRCRFKYEQLHLSVRVINHFYNTMPSRSVIPLCRMINDTLINENYERLFKTNITVLPLIYYRKNCSERLSFSIFPDFFFLYRYPTHEDYAFAFKVCLQLQVCKALCILCIL